MKKGFAGKVAWITGGGSGIGRALAHELAVRGAIVAVSGRRADRLEMVAAEINAGGGTGVPPIHPSTTPLLSNAWAVSPIGSLGSFSRAAFVVMTKL